MKIRFTASLAALAMLMAASGAQAQQFITAIDTDDNGDNVHVDLAKDTANTLVSHQRNGSDVKALTQLGVNKVYGSAPNNNIELSATSAWLDHFTVAGPVGSTVKMKFSFAVDGLAAFNDASGWNATHFNFQVFALRGDGWSINGSGGAGSGSQNTAWTAGTDYDELFFQRYVPERDPMPGQTLPPGQTKLPAGVVQLDARRPEAGVFNYAARADQSPGAFGSNAIYDAARDAYVIRTPHPMNASLTITTTFFADRRETQTGTGQVSTLYYDATGNAAIALQAANAKGTRANFEKNFSILDIGSFCPFDSLAGELQCGPGSYDKVVSVEFDIIAGSTFALAGIMVLDELEDGTIDFFNTARLSKIEAAVDGNPGATITISSAGLGRDLSVGPDGFDYPSMAAPAVPEPASWAMMIGGFALAGGLIRRRTTKIAFA